MVAIYALATFFIISLCEGKSELIECIRGEQAVCGNDGITYSNMCDLEIVRLVRTNLTVVHEGPCNSLIKTLIRALQMQQPRKNINSLRIRSWRPGNKINLLLPPGFGIQLLSQMINTQRNIGGFEFKHNNINTQGTNNEFAIDVS